MFSRLVSSLRNLIFSRTTLETFLEDERQEALAAAQDADRGPQEGTAAEPEWISTHTLDAPIMPVEEMRWFKRRRAMANYGNGNATESDLACLTQEELDRLEAIEIQVRWDQFLKRSKGVDVRPGRYFK